MSPYAARESRTEIHSGGEQGLLSSARKFAGSGFGVWPRRGTLIAAMAAWVFLPIEASDASWLSDVFKSSPKHDKSPAQVASRKVTSRKPATRTKSAASPRHHTVKLAALGPAVLSPLKPVA